MLGLIHDVGEAAVVRLVGVHPGLVVHPRRDLVELRSAPRRVRLRHGAVDLVEHLGHALVIAGRADGQAGRAVNHHQRVLRHADLIASHGNERSGRRCEPVDVDDHTTRVAGQRVVDRGAIERVASGAIDPHVNLGGVVLFGEEVDDVRCGDAVAEKVAADHVEDQELSDGRIVGFRRHVLCPVLHAIEVAV
jgi:hypothetical protein